MEKKIDLEDLKRIQIEILDIVTDFCNKNKIKYFLDAGTLLGSVRHKGYIPWDDDIDIAMLREDYNRFINSFNKSNNRYQVYCVENNNDFLYPYSKILDTKTVLYEPDKNGNKISVNIDLFPLDNAPDDDKILDKMYKKRDKLRKYHFILNNDLTNKSLVKKIIIKCMRLFFPRHYFATKITKLEQKYNKIDTIRISSFSGYNSSSCEKKVFESVIDSDFEGKKYKIPVGYDLWLKALYGDYMKLPPEKKRVSHHQFEAYYK